MATEFGIYKGVEVKIHFLYDKSSLYCMRMPFHPDVWHIPFQGIYPFAYARHKRVKDAYLGDYGPPERQPHFAAFFRALRRFQRRWRHYGGTRRRCKERCAAIKEELMAAAWSPQRVSKWLDAGVEPEDL